MTDILMRPVVWLQVTVAELREREDGQTTTEYAILLGFLAIAIIIALFFLRNVLRGLFSTRRAASRTLRTREGARSPADFGRPRQDQRRPGSSRERRAGAAASRHDSAAGAPAGVSTRLLRGRTTTVERSGAMAVARVTEISSTSSASFEDAIKTGLDRANQTLRNVKSAWIKEQQVRLEAARLPSTR